MVSYKIRMLTLHIPASKTPEALEDLDGLTARLLEAADEVASILGREVETVRIVLKPGSLEGLNLEAIAETAESHSALVSLGPFPVDRLDREEQGLLRAAELGLFYHILLDALEWRAARRVSEHIHSLADRDPSIATRMGVNAFGREVLTPYYPLASSADAGDPSLTVALTYPNYLLDAYKTGGPEGMVAAIEAAGREALRALDIAAESMSVHPLGVDLSVAPWMEESSLALVEYIAGVRMPEPGFLLGIYRVNSAIGEAASSLGRVVGFNEIQLPVAEDLKLKKRVAELDTSARDLARFSCLCLAGLDLAVVPASVDGVAGLILDVASCSRTKGRPLGVRIVPVEDVEPGDKVWLDKFGETPVIPL